MSSEEDKSTPLPYEEWSDKPLEREYAAAYVFGFDLMRHCREEALRAARKMPPGSDPMEVAEKAVDVALHNVMDMFEGFWRLDAGPNHRVDYILTVRVKNLDGQELERIELSPVKMDLPIGYWKWRDGGFR